VSEEFSESLQGVKERAKEMNSPDFEELKGFYSQLQGPVNGLNKSKQTDLIILIKLLNTALGQSLAKQEEQQEKYEKLEKELQA